jgi:RNA polymerase sigma factor (sigma-70 family)
LAPSVRCHRRRRRPSGRWQVARREIAGWLRGNGACLVALVRGKALAPILGWQDVVGRTLTLSPTFLQYRLPPLPLSLLWPLRLQRENGVNTVYNYLFPTLLLQHLLHPRPRPTHPFCQNLRRGSASNLFMQIKTLGIVPLIAACRRQERHAQEELYRRFYAYGTTVCLHYAANREEARDIVQEGFFLIFKQLNKYDERRPFKPWLRRVLINAAIDHHRKYNKSARTIALASSLEPVASSDTGFDQLALDDLLLMVQRLSPGYQMVFNLYVVEGFSHREISERLDITESASKSNLSRAKQHLRNVIVTEAQRTDKKNKL